MVKKHIIIISILLIMISISGCGTDNSSMYEVKQPVVIEEEGPQEGYGHVEAQVAEGADTDKTLGKKHLVMVNGQPIAELVDNYENEYGYTSSDNSDNNKNEINEGSSQAAKVLSLIIESSQDKDDKNTSLEASLFKEICDANKITYFDIDVTSMEKQAETDNSISITNTENVKNIIMAFPADNKDMAFCMYYMSFDTENDAKNAFELLCELYEEYNDYTVDGIKMQAIIPEGSKLDDVAEAKEDVYTVTYLTSNKGIFTACYSVSNTNGEEVVNLIKEKLKLE